MSCPTCNKQDLSPAKCVFNTALFPCSVVLIEQDVGLLLFISETLFLYIDPVTHNILYI